MCLPRNDRPLGLREAFQIEKLHRNKAGPRDQAFCPGTAAYRLPAGRFFPLPGRDGPDRAGGEPGVAFVFTGSGGIFSLRSRRCRGRAFCLGEVARRPPPLARCGTRAWRTVGTLGSLHEVARERRLAEKKRFPHRSGQDRRVGRCPWEGGQGRATFQVATGGYCRKNKNVKGVDPNGQRPARRKRILCEKSWRKPLNRAGSP